MKVSNQVLLHGEDVGYAQLEDAALQSIGHTPSVVSGLDRR